MLRLSMLRCRRLAAPRAGADVRRVARRLLSARPTADFIAAGPLFREARLPRPDGNELRRWHELGDAIATGASEEALRRDVPPRR